MDKDSINKFIHKHYKKVLPLLLFAPLTSKAQDLKQSEIESIEKIEVIDSTAVNPEYDLSEEPHVAESCYDLPQMSAKQALISPHKIYVGYFDNKGELQVIRTDCRYSAAAPDLLTGVFRAECPHYSQSVLTERHIEGKIPRGFTKEEYLNYLKSPNNPLGEVIRDYCNFRKKLINTANGRRSIVVRAGFFQGGVNEWSDCLRAAFCSPDVYAQKFASEYIESTPENLAIRDSVINSTYQNNELIIGEEGVKKRLAVRPLLSKIKVSGLRAKVGGITCLSDKFCDSLKYYTHEQKFDSDEKNSEFNKMSNAVKNMQVKYLTEYYLLAKDGTKTADIVDTYMAQELNKKNQTSEKVTPQKIKEHGFGIYAGIGRTMGYVESNVNGGPYFDGYYRGKNGRTFNGFYKLTEQILKKFMQPFDKNKIFTLEYLYQASVIGISGAQKTYEKFKEKQNVLQQEEQIEFKKMEEQYFQKVAPRDAIAPFGKFGFPMQNMKDNSR